MSSDESEVEGGEGGVTVFDIGHLAVFDSRDVEQEHGVSWEDKLNERSCENVEGLLRRLFDLPVLPPEPEIPGRVATLPKPTTHLPREKPLPAQKELTTWEKFAKTKGIVKKKKSRMVFDEKEEKWAPRFGYKKANDEMDVWAIPAGKDDEVGADPWTTAAAERKERINKNKKQQLRNVKSALKKAPGKLRVDGAIDLSEVSKSVSGGSKAGTKKKKTHVDVSLALAQKSTASMGRFDKMRHYEPEVKLFKAKKETDKTSVASEKASSMGIFNKLLGKQEKEGKGGFDAKKAANMAVNPKSFGKTGSRGGGGFGKGGSKGGKGGGGKGKGKGGKGGPPSKRQKR